MPNQNKVDELLSECGASLERSGKHEVWKLPNGKKFTRAKTPSDTFAAVENQMRDLRHALGLVDPTPKLEEGLRRAKRSRRIDSRSLARPSLASAMETSGIVSIEQLADKIENQRHQLTRLQRRNEKYISQRNWLLRNRCRWCRFKHFWHRWWSGHYYEPLDETGE